MSRREQFEKRTNPAVCTLEWAGGADAGYFKYYDKENKQNVRLDELSFVVLGERNCVRGWYEEAKSNAYSNEVGSLKNQELTVKYFKDGKPKELIHGKYEDIKGELANYGIKYNKAIYIMVIDCDKIETGTVAKIMLKGAAAGAWFEVKNKQDGLTSAEPKAGKKGSVRFMVPQFTEFKVEGDVDEEAELAYEQVKAYFSTAPHTTEQTDRVPAHVVDASESQVPEEEGGGLPF